MSSDVPLSKRIELLAFLCYLATEELDLDAAIDLGQSALAVAATGTARSESALAQVTLSLALALSGDHERAAALAEEARVGYDDGDRRRRPLGRRGGRPRPGPGCRTRGKISTVATMTPEIVRHCEPIGYDVFVVPAMLLQAWVAEQASEYAAAERPTGAQ